ncbi:MAG: hypothetical protein AN484_25675 [Aphanizomenon flos-aquae WA102]|uniref:Uncharacterized protein n=1 Tax=Aphanizomenon flos-aquae WA102 TaxID=1710896 RepID=A0A1B7WHA4_APHFL|nr:MAG: hypothetical protein AN484_25675 [Aphanizomenon flos-aquae WA102]
MDKGLDMGMEMGMDMDLDMGMDIDMGNFLSLNDRYLSARKSNGKLKTFAQTTFPNPFAHCANGSLPFVRYLANKKS